MARLSTLTGKGFLREWGRHECYGRVNSAVLLGISTRIQQSTSRTPKKSPINGIVIKINEQGEILESLHDPKGLKVHTITNTIERDSVLFFGSLFNNAGGKLDLRELHHRMQ